MTTKMSQVAALAMSERIAAAATEALLDWGEAINEAEALPAGALKDVATTKARLCGGEAQRLAMGLARTLRPRRTT